MTLYKSVGILCMMMAVIFLTCSQMSWGQDEINIVSPSEAADVEGDLSVNGGGDTRTQFLYPAADFMSLPESHPTIVGMAWRPDESNRLIEPITGPVKLSLSTTDADRLSSLFASNLGDDETLVFEGTINWQTDDTGPGPRDFDFVIAFDEPFTYDRSQGKNLLVDFIAPSDSNNVGNWQIDRQSTDAQTWAASANPQATAAGVFANALIVTQFTFVPEPSTFALTAMGFLGAVCYRRRLRLSRV